MTAPAHPASGRARALGDLSTPDVFLHILERHLEDLDFLLEQRESLRFAPDWTADELLDHEGRADAHLAGLRVGGAHAAKLALSALQGKRAFAAAAGARVLLALGPEALRNDVVLALSSAKSEARHGIRVALRHAELGELASTLAKLCETGAPEVRVAAADVLAFHRRHRADLPRGPPELRHGG